MNRYIYVLFFILMTIPFAGSAQNTDLFADSVSVEEEVVPEKKKKSKEKNKNAEASTKKSSSKNAKPLLKKALKHFRKMSYSKAVPLFKEVVKLEPENQDAIRSLASGYYYMNERDSAEQWYGKLMGFEVVEPIQKLQYAQVLMSLGKYEFAKAFLDNYLNEAPGDRRAANLRRACDHVDKIKNQGKIRVVNLLEVNSSGPDFGPNYYLDEIIFASNRNNRKKKYKWNGQSFLDFFTAEYNGVPELGDPLLLKSPINTKFHEAIAAIEPDTSKIYFTRNNFNQGKKGMDQERVIRLKLYEASYKKGKWVKVKEMKYNSDDYSVGHPSVSADGQTLYFVSDMAGTYGLTDIYKARKSNGEWGEPQNLGEIINTEGKEMFPWISPENILYFASDGHEGLGGLDIFSVDLNSPNPKVQNMGAPLNSIKDDFSMITDKEAGIGFFTSNRFGGKGDDDIYSFYLEPEVRGYVIDAVTKEPLDSVEITLVGEYEVQSSSLSLEDGEFNQPLSTNMEYTFKGKKEGYEPHKVEFNTLQGDDGEYRTVIIKMMPTKAAKKGPCSVNLGVVYGLAKKPAPNTPVHILDTSDPTIEGLKYKTDVNGLLEVGLEQGRDYTILIESPGKVPLQRKVSTKGSIDDCQFDINVAIRDFSVGDVFFIIYYDFDKDNIRFDASKELDEVAEIMFQFPDMIVKLSAHTDSRGSISYNEKLSERRAVSAFEYLVDKGIEPYRLRYEWLGERKLINNCRDGIECSDEAHQMNRRTEFKLVAKYNTGAE